ncbi:hypothetical protein A0H81_05741 [Grifola frondosa]|uniref:Uncharacterized protein n=1 Tax=Grifola frondosa TaxID=5627 RepID=A0A1C7MD63_GRIFR|nr:hypothetical protein A0H81_05741 [Grifola frondosa]
MAEGIATLSQTQDRLRLETDVSPEFEYHVRRTTGAVYGAGEESTYATVLTFILVMALHPRAGGDRPCGGHGAHARRV